MSSRGIELKYVKQVYVLRSYQIFRSSLDKQCKDSGLLCTYQLLNILLETDFAESQKLICNIFEVVVIVKELDIWERISQGEKLHSEW